MTAVHRWQPTGFTPCGRGLESVRWNYGQYLSDGVTCRRCLSATTLTSLMNQPFAPLKEEGPHFRFATAVYRLGEEGES